MSLPGCLEIARAANLEPGRIRGDEHFFRCPRHDDRDPSLRINPAKKGFSCKPCNAGGNYWEFAAFLAGADPKDKPAVMSYLRSLGLAESGGGAPRGGTRVVTRYPYTDESGNLLFEVVRFEPKDFRQRRPDGSGGWIWDMEGVRRVPYNLPELRKAGRVFIVEGEKDVESLRKIGLIATCNPGGADNWTDDISRHFNARHRPAIIPDNDDPGHRHARKVAESLHGRVASLKLLELDGLPEKGDVSDWLRGRDPEEAAKELTRLAEAAPEWRPPMPEDPWDAATFTLADACRERPSREYLVEGLISIPSLVIVYGQPGCLKSALLADMAVCVASGLPWLPRRGDDISGKATNRSPVQWIDYDNGELTHNRFEAFARAHNLPPGVPLYYSIMPDPWLDGSNEEHMSSLAARLEARGIRLAVIDNFKTVCGRLDENKPEVAAVMSQFRRMVDRLRMCVILIHHPPKADDEILRGHGSILASLDLSLHVRRDGQSETVSVKPVKSRAAVPEAFAARFEFTHKPGTRDLETARFRAESAKAGIRLTPSEKEVLEVVVKARSAKVEEIGRSVRKTSPETARRAVWSLARQGLIVRVDNGGNGRQAMFEPVRNRVAQVVSKPDDAGGPVMTGRPTGTGDEND
jgi:hypothetical protein